MEIVRDEKMPSSRAVPTAILCLSTDGAAYTGPIVGRRRHPKRADCMHHLPVKHMSLPNRIFSRMPRLMSDDWNSLLVAYPCTPIDGDPMCTIEEHPLGSESELWPGVQ